MSERGEGCAPVLAGYCTRCGDRVPLRELTEMVFDERDGREVRALLCASCFANALASGYPGD